MESKVIQVSTTQDKNDETVIIALCEDGSLWSCTYLEGVDEANWSMIPMPPKQPER